LSLKLEPTLDEDVAYGMRLLVGITERLLSESPPRPPRRRSIARRQDPGGSPHHPEGTLVGDAFKQQRFMA